MPAFHLSSAVHGIVLALLGCISFCIAWFSYRVTVPPVSTRKRFLLFSLRGLGLFFLFFMICEPIVTVSRHNEERPTVAVFIDNSQSMAIQERTGKRSDVLRSVASSNLWRILESKSDVSYFVFDTKSRLLKKFTLDSLTMQGTETDIAQSLSSAGKVLQGHNIQAAVIVTDGNSTVGANPLYDVEAMGVPCFTVGIGDTMEQKDVFIRSILTNELAYVGTRLPIHVMIHSAGYSGEQIKVTVTSNNEHVDEKVLTLETGSRDYALVLNALPMHEGLQKFTVHVAPLPGELTVQNNQRSVFVKVLKSKIRTLLVASTPSEDVAFIRRAIERDTNISLTAFIEYAQGQPQGKIADKKIFDETECIVLVGFPFAESLPENIRLLTNELASGKPFLFITARTIDFAKLETIKQHLPFYWQRSTAEEELVFMEVNQAQQLHPVIKTSTDQSAQDVCSNLPPVYYQLNGYKPKPEAIVLATARVQSTVLPDPIVILQNTPNQKSEAILAYGLWRWQLFSDAGTPQERYLEQMLQHSIRWLTTREDNRRIRILPVKDAFTSQEAVEFSGQVYDDTYQPMDQAQFDVTVKHGSESSTIRLSSLGNGQYHGSFDMLPEGEYTFSAQVFSGEKELGTGHGEFSVGAANSEFFETRMNQPLLQQMAAQTGGKYYSASSIASIPDDIANLPNFKSKDIIQSYELVLWNSRWFLILVVCIFSLEWFLRKQSGML